MQFKSYPKKTYGRFLKYKSIIPSSVGKAKVVSITAHLSTPEVARGAYFQRGKYVLSGSIFQNVLTSCFGGVQLCCSLVVYDV